MPLVNCDKTALQGMAAIMRWLKLGAALHCVSKRDMAASALDKLGIDPKWLLCIAWRLEFVGGSRTYQNPFLPHHQQ